MRIFHTIEIQAYADDVWRVAGRPELIGQFHPEVEEATLDGDRRTCLLADGSRIEERIVDRSIAHRFYTYELAGGAPGLSSYRGCLAVRGHGDHCHVDWDLQLVAESSDDAWALARRADAACGEALEHLRERLEARVAA